MRKLVIGLAMATTALATPAVARDGSWYVGAEGGPMIVEDFIINQNGTPNASRIDSDVGYDFGGYVGHDFGLFRIEAEGSYRRADLDTFRGAIRTQDSTGAAEALSFMGNVLLDLGADDGIQGSVGAGVGVSRVELVGNLGAAAGPFRFIDDSDTRAAWQALAEVRAPVTRNIDAGLRYRFFNAPNLRMLTMAGDDIGTRFRSHSLLGTLTYNFGAPEPEPVYVAPPAPTYTPPPTPTYTPPPPPPQTVQCQSGPYIVFFDWDRSNITPEAAQVLDNAISNYASCGNASIMLAGYTDRSGTTQYNLGLSQRRNQSVQAYLTSHGISGGSIATQAFGETNPRVPTADGVRELQNRRVEITYGPNSGM